MTAVSDVLELHEAEDAFRRIEYWLRARGFFVAGGEALVADLYLGYGLSQSIRRRSIAAPPEPCRPLPLAACRIRQLPGVEQYLAEDCRIGEWTQTWAAAEYEAAVERVRDAIARGDVYQVNLKARPLLEAIGSRVPEPVASR